jgi:hypothetical protein
VTVEIVRRPEPHRTEPGPPVVLKQGRVADELVADADPVPEVQVVRFPGDLDERSPDIGGVALAGTKLPLVPQGDRLVPDLRKEHRRAQPRGDFAPDHGLVAAIDQVLRTFKAETRHRLDQRCGIHASPPPRMSGSP